jgi:hypothetical protein
MAKLGITNDGELVHIASLFGKNRQTEKNALFSVHREAWRRSDGFAILSGCARLLDRTASRERNSTFNIALLRLSLGI